MEKVVVQRKFRSMIDSSLRDKYNNICVSRHLNQIWGKFPILLSTLECDCRKFRGFELVRRVEVVEGDYRWELGRRIEMVEGDYRLELGRRIEVLEGD